jgi:undecaprenyl-diphosphatase
MLYNATGGITWAVMFGTLGYLFGRKVPQLEQYLGQATLAVVLLATVFVALVLGGRWFLEHADRLAERVSRAADQIARARLFRSFPNRHPRAWRFILRRFAAGEYLGLHLTVGLIVSLAAVWVFGGVTEDVIHHDPLTHFDVTLLEWLHQHRTPFAFTMFAAITRLGSPVLIAGVAIVVDVVLAIRERWLQFLSWNAALGGAAVLSMVLKRVIQRPRPVYAAALHEYSDSFPSGHALGSLIGYGMLAYLLAVFWAKRPDTQVAIVAAATLLIAAIGLSRLYLGVHYFSDIIAGYAAGMVWLSTCITALEVARRQPANASPI